MNKKISKSMMDRRRLRNRFLRTRSNGNKEVINRGTIQCLSFGKLSKSTTTTLIIGR